MALLGYYGTSLVGPAKHSNLPSPRYAFANESEVYGRRSTGIGMLVDFEVIKRAQSGDSAAFNEVVLAYRKRVLGTIARSIARPEDVEDVAQEVFLRLYFSLEQLRTPEVFEPWLYRLTVNAAYDYLRKQRRRMEFRMSDLSEQQVIMADAVAGGKIERDELYHKKIRESVDSLLGAVSEADRILLMLKEVDGLSLKELEKIYKVNENALKVRLFRARQRVLKAFGAADKDKTPKGKTPEGGG
jgi:RNA polymerase sigma-70 factor (ECF subfamily)